jgi:hypothetical protein
MKRMISTTTMLVITFFAGCAITLYTMAARAQWLSADPQIAGLPAAPKTTGPVSFLGDVAHIAAGHADAVELHFHVADGFHINSHKPNSDLLLATTLTAAGSEGLRLQATEFPNGRPFHLAIGAGETLDVYEGDFRLTVRVVAPKGMSTLRGVLHYQACDHAACYPPRTLPFVLHVQAD